MTTQDPSSRSDSNRLALPLIVVSIIALIEAVALVIVLGRGPAPAPSPPQAASQAPSVGRTEQTSLSNPSAPASISNPPAPTTAPAETNSSRGKVGQRVESVGFGIAVEKII